MDDLIRAYIVLYERYAELQADMDKISATAFIRLSRCRYNGINISADQFRPETGCFLSAHLRPKIDESTRSGELPTEAISSPVLREKSNNIIEDEKDVEVGKLSDALEATEVSDTSSHIHVDSEDDKDTARLSFQMVTSHEKKLNPMRDIELLPSSILRQTQSSFQALINKGLQLASIIVEIGQLETEIQAVESREQTHNHPDSESIQDVEHIDDGL